MSKHHDEAIAHARATIARCKANQDWFGYVIAKMYLSKIESHGKAGT